MSRQRVNKMDRGSFLKIVAAGAGGLALSSLTGCSNQGASRINRPNIILIMSDDMGFSDIGCYGGEIQTPNLDQLASGGCKFTQFYNTARCCPTRASLITGLYPHQTGLGWMTAEKHPEPGYQGEINNKCVTIPEALQSAGYKSYMSGKWHVAHDKQPDGPKYNWPLQRGFDRFYGTILGAGSYYDPGTLTRGNTMITPENDPEYQPEKYYYTDAISDNAVKYIDEHNGDDPFFMYVSYTAAHWPMHAPEEVINKYKGKYSEGWQYHRRQRFQRMVEMGLIDKDWGMSEPENPGWQNEDQKAWMQRRMEVYAAMIDIMDQGIGRIVNKLKQNGIFENTIIMFLQDNGGCAELYGSTGPVSPKNFETVSAQPKEKNELTLAMEPEFTRDGRPVKTGEGVMPGPADTYIAYGQEWANVSNTPFREYKHWVHEGGIATPLIVSWPKKLKDSGEIRRQPSHVIDIMATCLDVAGASYPKSRDGSKITPLEGNSLLPTILKNRNLDREAIYWEHEGNRAVRMGKWKLVSKGKLSNGGYGTWQNVEFGPWELYDMEKDRVELHDLSNERPELTEKMASMWQKYAETSQVFPMPWEIIES